MRKKKAKTSTETIENKEEVITSKELIEFSKRLYDYLKKNNIKQKDFADQIGCSAQFLSNLLKHRDDETISNNDESNPTKPSFEFLTKLHEVTGVSMDYWFGYSDNDQATKNDIPTSYTYKDLFLMLTYLSNMKNLGFKYGMRPPLDLNDDTYQKLFDKWSFIIGNKERFGKLYDDFLNDFYESCDIEIKAKH